MKEWEKLQTEVFSDDIKFDMSALSGEQSKIKSSAICKIWKNGFKGIDAINYLAGNFLIQIDDRIVSVFAYTTATHYKESATYGKTRE